MVVLRTNGGAVGVASKGTRQRVAPLGRSRTSRAGGLSVATTNRASLAAGTPQTAPHSARQATSPFSRKHVSCCGPSAISPRRPEQASGHPRSGSVPAAPWPTHTVAGTAHACSGLRSAGTLPLSSRTNWPEASAATGSVQRRAPSAGETQRRWRPASPFRPSTKKTADPGVPGCPAEILGCPAGVPAPRRRPARAKPRLLRGRTRPPGVRLFS